MQFLTICLVLKGWTALLKNLQAVQQSQSQLKQSISTRMSKQIESCFIGWRFVSIYNRKNRLAGSIIRQKIANDKKKKTFYTWIEAALSTQKARVFYLSKVYKRVLTGFFMYFEQKEIKAERLRSLKSFHEIKLSKQVLQLWRVIAAKEQRERLLRRAIGKYYKEQLLKKGMNAL